MEENVAFVQSVVYNYFFLFEKRHTWISQRETNECCCMGLFILHSGWIIDQFGGRCNRVLVTVVILIQSKIFPLYWFVKTIIVMNSSCTPMHIRLDSNPTYKTTDFEIFTLYTDFYWYGNHPRGAVAPRASHVSVALVLLLSPTISAKYILSFDRWFQQLLLICFGLKQLYQLGLISS